MTEDRSAFIVRLLGEYLEEQDHRLRSSEMADNHQSFAHRRMQEELDALSRRVAKLEGYGSREKV